MTNRDYHNLDLYYEELLGDVYPQPMDDGHLKNMKDIITRWIVPLGAKSVLDAGSGEGDSQAIFSQYGIAYCGIALGDDVKTGWGEHKRFVFPIDFNFTGYDEDSFNLVFSRHSLEHSPFPILTLMEWHRVSNKWLCLVVPNPNHYTRIGRNHYSVGDAHQNAWWLRRAGWKLNRVGIFQDEYWFLCTKTPRISYEGWADVPLHNKIYEFERDLEEKKGEINVPEYFGSRGWHGLF